MKVAIFGCGYVGLALGSSLADAGHDVVGVRRSDEGLSAIEDAGFRAVRGDVTEAESLADVPDADWLVFAVSPNVRDVETTRRVHVGGLETVVDAFADRDSPPDRLVYTSTTGVYGDHDGAWVDESTPVEPSTEKLSVFAEAERIALDRAPVVGIDGTVVRFAGLYGPGRWGFDRYLEGPVAEGYVNLIHRDDAAGAIEFLLENERARGEVVNVVDDEPAPKWDLAEWLAEARDVDPPSRVTVDEYLAAADLPPAARRRVEANKRVSNERLRALGYDPAYPTFRDGYSEATDAGRSS
ncbi:MAG: nucleoside-diphosphate-sugar epimerase [Halobacteriales archaeon]|jgi:nucleoside-diphosphate-sugar epimerase